MPTVPTDPVGTGSMHYRYYVYGAGTGGCDASRGPFYVLGINDMETSSGVHPQNPGWSCLPLSGRIWQNKFEWVTGGFLH